MRRDPKSIKAIALSAGIILGVLLLIILVSRNLSAPKQPGEAASISLTQDGRQITVSIDGSVFENGVLVDTWSAEKTRAFFDYYNAQYASYQGGQTVIVFSGPGGESTSSVPAGDELTDIVFGGGGTGGGGNGNGGGGTGGFFQSGSPTPTPLPYGESSPLPSSIPNWCKHWLLSYCADTPAPSSTPTPSPAAGPTPLPPDCNNVGNQETGRTVISNELCVPSPTP